MQWGTTNPGYGQFIFTSPGVGAAWADVSATIAPSAGGFTVSYSGAGRVDHAALVNTTFGSTFEKSGASQPATISLTATIDATKVVATATITVDGQSYTVSAPAPTHNAGPAVDQFIAALRDANWTALHDMLYSEFRNGVTVAELSAGIQPDLAASGTLLGGSLIAPSTYPGEPGAGYRIAKGDIMLSFSANGSMKNEHSGVIFIQEQGVWKVLNLDTSVPATVVSPANMQGWGFLQETATASGSLVTGPGTPAFGTGSAKLHLSTTGGGELIGTVAFAGTRLDAMRALSYRTFVPTTSPGTVQAPSLQFDIDYNLSDTNTAWQGRLVYEPYRTETVTKGIWQTWNPLAGKWWATANPGKVTCPQATPCAWAQVLQAYPNAGLRVSVGGLSFKAGSGWPANYDGHVDGFVIVAGDTVSAFDFEAMP